MTVPFVSGEALTDLLEGELVFDAADPYAVTMHLEAKSGTRHLDLRPGPARRGPLRPVGDGDVQVWPCLSGAGEAVVIIELCSPDRHGDAADRFARDPDLRHLDLRASSRPARRAATSRIDALVAQLLAA